ncbi:MAG: hypothetical protein ACKOYH_03480 [Cyanobium sp.]
MAVVPPLRLVGASGRVVLGMALLALLAPPAGASSPAAWRAYDQEVRSACLKASRLVQPRVMGERIDVPVADVSPKAHRAGRKGRELCLFEQRTRQATVGVAEALDRPRPNP